MSPLLNVWKFFGKLRGKKHRKVQKQIFRQVSKIFKDFRKSSEIFGKIGECHKVLKMTFQYFWIFLQIFGNYRKSSELFGRLRKSSENFRNCCKMLLRKKKQLSSIFEFFLKSSEIVGSLRKSSEFSRKIGKCRKVLKTIFRHFL